MWDLGSVCEKERKWKEKINMERGEEEGRRREGGGKEEGRRREGGGKEEGRRREGGRSGREGGGKEEEMRRRRREEN